MGNFRKLFQKVNGTEVLKQYARAHVLLLALIEAGLLGVSRKSLEIVRLIVDQKVLCRLRKKYAHNIAEHVKTHPVQKGKNSKRVWFCWFQGLAEAPDIVKKCYQSLQNNLKDYEIIVITDENYQDYVTFPEHIMEKYRKGTITRTHLSDLLRLELLLTYGGIWIDATVYCSGADIPEYMLDSDLFLFQCLKPGRDGHAAVISSWFISACANHPILLLTRDLLYEYWKKYNYMKDYFLLHDFMQLAIEAYPEEWNAVIPFSNSVPHILLLNLFEKYDAKWMEAVANMTPFHKLSYKFSEEQKRIPDTYYLHLLDSNGEL